jgi:hypothetical protein
VKPGFCPQCGAAAAPNARFCHICGTEIPANLPLNTPSPRKRGFPWKVVAGILVLLVVYSAGRSSTSPSRTQQMAMTAKTATASVPTSTPNATMRARIAADQTQEAKQQRIDDATATAVGKAEATVARKTEVAEGTQRAIESSTATAEAKGTSIAAQQARVVEETRTAKAEAELAATATTVAIVNATAEQATLTAEQTRVARTATAEAQTATSVSLTATAMPTPTATATPQPTATPAPTATPLPTATPTPVPIGSTVDVPAPLGTTLTADGLAVTVESAYFDYGFANAIPRGGYKVMIVQVTIRNDGDGNQSYNASSFSGIDANTDVAYNPVTLDDVGVLLRDGNLQPGQYVSGTVLIEVQETATNVIIKYDPNMFTTEDLYWS